MKTKVKIFFAVIFVLIIGMIPNKIFATTGKYEDLNYEIEDNKIIITQCQYNQDKKEMIIPEYIDGYPVVEIGEFAFEGMGFTNIIIPNTVTKIGMGAFFDNPIVNINIPTSVTSIDSSAFGNCNNLTNIIVDTNNSSYCSIDGVLYSKNKDTIIKYPQAKTNESYSIPNTVTIIGDSAFAHSELRNIILPDKLKIIENFAFDNCINLTAINLTNSLEEIGNYAFRDCIGLKELYISSNVTKIGKDIIVNSDDTTGKHITIYVDENSFAEQYMKTNNITYKIMEKETDVTINLSNDSTSIKLNANNNVIPQDTILITEEITSGDTYTKIENALINDVKDFVLYDITLESNNVKIQPNGVVTISIPIPNDFNSNEIVIYRVNDDLSTVEYNFTIETIDGKEYARFETDHFSNYVIAEKQIKSEQTEEHILDDEPKTGIMNIVIITVSVLGISTFGWVIVNKKMYK